jgi:integrating conjugative element protein (TIGR03749 family)
MIRINRARFYDPRTFLTYFTGKMPALIAFLICGSGHATEVIRWQRQPIAIELHAGQERIVFVDRPMRVAVPTALVERLRVQSADGAVYLLANEAFPATRIELQDSDTGTLVLLDVQASKAEAQPILEPVRITVAKQREGEEKKDEHASNEGEASASSGTTPLAVLLTRYAAQSLYAPLRTIEPLPGVIPTPMRPTLDLSTLLPALSVNLTVLGAWRLQDEWVSAIQVTNLTANWRDLDPRLLQGEFLAATFQHRQIGPQGEPTDTTVVYLVTRGHGLAESLLPALSPIDPSQNLSTDKLPVSSSHEK